MQRQVKSARSAVREVPPGRIRSQRNKTDGKRSLCKVETWDTQWLKTHQEYSVLYTEVAKTMMEMACMSKEQPTTFDVAVDEA